MLNKRKNSRMESDYEAMVIATVILRNSEDINAYTSDPILEENVHIWYSYLLDRAGEGNENTPACITALCNAGYDINYTTTSWPNRFRSKISAIEFALEHRDCTLIRACCTCRASTPEEPVVGKFDAEDSDSPETRWTWVERVLMGRRLEQRFFYEDIFDTLLCLQRCGVSEMKYRVSAVEYIYEDDTKGIPFEILERPDEGINCVEMDGRKFNISRGLVQYAPPKSFYIEALKELAESGISTEGRMFMIVRFVVYNYKLESSSKDSLAEIIQAHIEEYGQDLASAIDDRWTGIPDLDTGLDWSEEGIRFKHDVVDRDFRISIQFDFKGKSLSISVIIPMEGKVIPDLATVDRYKRYLQTSAPDGYLEGDVGRIRIGDEEYELLISDIVVIPHVSLVELAEHTQKYIPVVDEMKEKWALVKEFGPPDYEYDEEGKPFEGGTSYILAKKRFETATGAGAK